MLRRILRTRSGLNPGFVAAIRRSVACPPKRILRRALPTSGPRVHGCCIVGAVSTGPLTGFTLDKHCTNPSLWATNRRPVDRSLRNAAAHGLTINAGVEIRQFGPGGGFGWIAIWDSVMGFFGVPRWLLTRHRGRQGQAERDALGNSAYGWSVSCVPVSPDTGDTSTLTVRVAPLAYDGGRSVFPGVFQEHD